MSVSSWVNNSHHSYSQSEVLPQPEGLTVVPGTRSVSLYDGRQIGAMFSAMKRNVYVTQGEYKQIIKLWYRTRRETYGTD